LKTGRKYTLTLCDVLRSFVISSHQPYLIFFYDPGIDKALDHAVVGRCAKPEKGNTTLWHFGFVVFNYLFRIENFC